MFPLEEGFGEPWFPIVRAGVGQWRVGGRALWERCRFEGVGRMSSASKLVCVLGLAWRLAAQDDLCVG